MSDDACLRNLPSTARRGFREAHHLPSWKRAELGPRSGSDKAIYQNHPESKSAAVGGNDIPTVQDVQANWMDTGWDVLEGTDTSDGSWGKRPQYFIDPFTDPFNKYSPRAYCRPGNGLGSGDSVCCCTSLLTELTLQALHV